MRSPSLAFSTKAREVSTRRTSVVLQAAITLKGPAVKLSIAATRPALCTAMKATAEPLAFGSISPTVSPGWREVARSCAPAARRRVRKRDGGELAADRVLNHSAAGRKAAVGEPALESLVQGQVESPMVAKMRSDMMS